MKLTSPTCFWALVLILKKFARCFWLKSAQRSIILQDVLGKIIYYSTTRVFLIHEAFYKWPLAVWGLYMHNNYSRCRKVFHNLHNPAVDIELHRKLLDIEDCKRLYIQDIFKESGLKMNVDIMQEQDVFMLQKQDGYYILQKTNVF